MISFFVPGIPVAKGNMRRSSKGRGMYDATKNQRPWADAVAYHALVANNGAGKIPGPVVVEVVFRFPRPKKHYRTGKHAGELRPDAPEWHAQLPDCDKLQRNLGDALKGPLLRDDGQIAHWVATKRWVGPDELPGASVSVRMATGAPAVTA